MELITMGILSPGGHDVPDRNYHPMMQPQPRQKVAKPDGSHEKIQAADDSPGCDLCGYSTMAGTRWIMLVPARWRIKLKSGNSFYLCEHHRRTRISPDHSEINVVEPA